MDFSKYNDEAFADLQKQVLAEAKRRDTIKAENLLRSIFAKYRSHESITIDVHFQTSADAMHFGPGVNFFDENDNYFNDEVEKELSDLPWLELLGFDGGWGDHEWYRFIFKRGFKDLNDYEEENAGQ